MYLPFTGKRSLIQIAGRLRISRSAEIKSKIASRSQCTSVILSQETSAPIKYFLVYLLCLFRMTKLS
jgi:hypothetical protein